jgi:hypothetical protein
MACRKANVRIDTIHVTKAEASAEPGVAAEWELDIIVNDQSRRWSNDDVRDNRDYVVGYDYPVDLPNDLASITIRTSGFELDVFTPNDPLPPAQGTHGSFDNWGIGGAHQISGSDRHFNYTVYYTNTCLVEA